MAINSSAVNARASFRSAWSTKAALDVHKEADTNNDGKISTQELDVLREKYSYIQASNRALERGFLERYAALTMLQENFGQFAGNRGIPGGPVTNDLWSDDFEIDTREILTIAREDGNSKNISRFDLRKEDELGPLPPSRGSVLGVRASATRASWNTKTVLDVHQQADVNKDGKVSREELSSLKQRYKIQDMMDVGRPEEWYQRRTQEKAALEMLQDNFGLFAINRGLPRDAGRTKEFRVGEDDHIRPNEILAIAREDGNAKNITRFDLGKKDSRPLPPSRPKPGHNDILDAMLRLLKTLLVFSRGHA